MKNTIINKKAIYQVAKALGSLNNEVVYVGGAMVSLYINDPAAEDVRPTKDIDLTFEILSLSELEKLRIELSKKGFTQSQEDRVLCRFRLDDKIVDVMSTHEVGWAPANRWFKPGFESSIKVNIDDLEIKIMPFEYYLASKFDAFKSRGNSDPLASHDFEDIIYLLNHTLGFNQIILESDKPVKSYLIECFKEIQNSKSLQEGIIGNLHYQNEGERFTMLMNEIKLCLNES